MIMSAISLTFSMLSYAWVAFAWMPGGVTGQTPSVKFWLVQQKPVMTAVPFSVFIATDCEPGLWPGVSRTFTPLTISFSPFTISKFVWLSRCCMGR